MIHHAGVLTHRTLRLTSRTRSEIDVGQLIRRNHHAEIRLSLILPITRLNEQRLDPRQRLQGRVQGGGAGRFGQHQPAAGPGKHGRNPIRREMRLDRQIHPTGLEDRKHRSQPIQIALGHHRHHTLTAQPTRQQSPSQPIGTTIELPVRQAAVPAHSGDSLRMSLHLLLEQLMNPAIRQLPPRPGQACQLKIELLRRQQALLLVLSIEIDGHQLQRREVITGDAGCAVRIEHIGPVPQAQYQLIAWLRDPDPQHDVLAEVAIRAGQVEDSLEAGTVTPSSRLSASNGKSACDSSCASTRWVSSSSSRHDSASVVSRHGNGPGSVPPT